MEDIKGLVAQALEQRHVLSKMKAELRAQVFLAIDEQERSTGGPGLASKTDNSKRTSLLSSSTGKLLAGLVHEFLEWTGMEFTLKVYEPEMGAPAKDMERQLLAEQMEALDAACTDEPLLMQLLNTWQHNPGSNTTAKKASVLPASSIPSEPTSALPAAPTGLSNAAAAASAELLLAARKPVLQPLQVAKGTTAATELTDSRLHQAASKIPTAVPAAATAAAEAPASKAAEQAADHSYADDVDVDIDDDLADAEIVDDDEDYAAVFASARKRRSSSSGGAGPGPAPPAILAACAARRTSSSSHSSHLHDASDSSAPLAPQAAPPGSQKATEHDAAAAAMDAAGSLSGLSGLSMSGRMRASKLRSLTAGASSLQEDMSNEMGEHSQDLFSGDRSFGYSHELAGLAPGPRELLAASNSGNNLSYSGELMAPAGQEHAKASTSDSTADALRAATKLDPLSAVKPPLPGKLSPLAPLSKPGTLAAVTTPSASLSTSGLSPLAPPAIGSRKDPNDIKAELRRAGLLNTDSFSMDLGKSNSGGSSHVSLGPADDAQQDKVAARSHKSSSDGSGLGTAPQAEASTHSNNKSSRSSTVKQSHDHARSSSNSQNHSDSGKGSRSSSGSGSELELPDASHSKGPAQATGVPASTLPSRPVATLRPLHGGVYDAEVSVSQSMDIATEIMDEESHGSITSGSMSVGEAVAGSKQQQAGREYQGSKGVSMDMRDTGLSTSDKSGDDVERVFANADLAETAEWAN